MEFIYDLLVMGEENKQKLWQHVKLCPADTMVKMFEMLPEEVQLIYYMTYVGEATENVRFSMFCYKEENEELKKILTRMQQTLLDGSFIPNPDAQTDYEKVMNYVYHLSLLCLVMFNEAIERQKNVKTYNLRPRQNISYTV